MTEQAELSHRCRPAAGGNAAAALPPRAPAQPSGPVSPGLHHVLPGPHLPGQPAQPAPPLLGPPGTHPFLGQVNKLSIEQHSCCPNANCGMLWAWPSIIWVAVFQYL